MQINFTYDKNRDIWCLLNKGRSSNNSQSPTKQYSLLVEKYGDNPTNETVSIFIDEYITKNKIDISERITNFQNDWESVSSEFQNIAENIFNISIDNNITAYLTINARCPYSIKENFFYTSLNSNQATMTLMHELWHFYTWYGLGVDQEEKIGKEIYNNLKESLTVLLNVECKNLLPKGIVDVGYPQHQDIRNEILQYWKKDKDIKNLWNYLIK